MEKIKQFEDYEFLHMHTRSDKYTMKALLSKVKELIDKVNEIDDRVTGRKNHNCKMK